MVSSRIPSYKMAISLHRSFKSSPLGASSNWSLISRDVASERPKESVPNFEKNVQHKKPSPFFNFFCEIILVDEENLQSVAILHQGAIGTNLIDFYGNTSNAFVVQKEKSLKKLFNELIVIGARF